MSCSPRCRCGPGRAVFLKFLRRGHKTGPVKHGHAGHIVIRLAADQEQGVLSIQDDGCGIDDNAPGNKGMGLHLMNYRARMVGGSLDVQRGGTGGTMVTCLFPVSLPVKGGVKDDARK